MQADDGVADATAALDNQAAKPGGDAPAGEVTQDEPTVAEPAVGEAGTLIAQCFCLLCWFNITSDVRNPFS